MVGGRLKIEVVDRAVTRVLRCKFALGLFERPYTDEKPEFIEDAHSRNTWVARQAAEESFVLLKNDPLHGKPILPLRR